MIGSLHLLGQFAKFGPRSGCRVDKTGAYFNNIFQLKNQERIDRFYQKYVFNYFVKNCLEFFRDLKI
jgi:hypothetical protein